MKKTRQSTFFLVNEGLIEIVTISSKYHFQRNSKDGFGSNSSKNHQENHISREKPEIRKNFQI